MVVARLLPPPGGSRQTGLVRLVRERREMKSDEGIEKVRRVVETAMYWKLTAAGFLRRGLDRTTRVRPSPTGKGSVKPAGGGWTAASGWSD